MVEVEEWLTPHPIAYWILWLWGVGKGGGDVKERVIFDPILIKKICYQGNLEVMPNFGLKTENDFESSKISKIDVSHHLDL